MKITDRYILKEFIKFTILALICVVMIYNLIDLFEELSYFSRRRVNILTVFEYYTYLTPQAITLLLPVALILATFLVYGMMTRHRELYAYLSAGINLFRLFRGVLILGAISVLVLFSHREWIEIPFAQRLADLKYYKIEKRGKQENQKRRDIYYVGENGKIYFIREFESIGILRNFYVLQLDKNRKTTRRIDGAEARYQNGIWYGRDVFIRDFLGEATEKLTHYDSLPLLALTEKPEDFITEVRPIEETQTFDLYHYLKKMNRAGQKVNEEEVEFNFRFANAFIGLIVILLALPLSVQLRRGGVMLGLGLGLLFSFLYWGLIQVSKAFGYVGASNPFLSAWLPNFIFGLLAIYFFIRLRQ
uniref:LptF/LptG family permease n=1 Tax=candidate division WOR-3 bacterium TaxID=2052148 RepID=A0A7C6EEU9_UNCW3